MNVPGYAQGLYAPGLTWDVFNKLWIAPLRAYMGIAGPKQEAPDQHSRQNGTLTDTLPHFRVDSTGRSNAPAPCQPRPLQSNYN